MKYLKGKINDFKRDFIPYCQSYPQSKELEKSLCFKWTYWLSENDYLAAILSKMYITASEIIMQSLRKVLQF